MMNGRSRKIYPGMQTRVHLIDGPIDQEKLPLSDHLFARVESGWLERLGTSMLVFPDIQGFWEKSEYFDLLDGKLIGGIAKEDEDGPTVSILTMGPEEGRERVSSKLLLEWYEDVWNVHDRAPVLLNV